MDTGHYRNKLVNHFDEDNNKKLKFQKELETPLKRRVTKRIPPLYYADSNAAYGQRSMAECVRTDSTFGSRYIIVWYWFLVVM
jgi:hypothetical protein